MTVPDSPLAQAAVIDRQASTPATNLAQRVDLLNSNGHQWMPADMQTTLASAPTSDTGLLGIAASIKNSLSKTWNGFTEATDDNVLHKQPTAALALARMLNSSLGPMPVAEEDLPTIQKNLQAQGFGTDLTADGAWGADWNDAYNAYSSHLIGRQLAGDQPGSVSTQSAGHSIFSDLLPSHAINAIVGYAKALPGDVRGIGADFASSGVNLGVDVKNLATNPVGAIKNAHFGRQHEAAAQAGADVTNVGNHAPITAQQYEQEANNPARVLQDVGTVLAITPIAGSVSAAGRVAESELLRGVTLDAASRGPGLVAKSMFGGLAKEQIAGLAEDATRADVRRGLLNTNLVRNLPLMGQVGPVVGRLADADGLYYRARTLLATPYAVPAVRIAGDIGQRVMLTGAALGAGAQLTNKLTGPNTLSSDIRNTNVTNDVDRNLDRIAGTPGQTPFTDLVNALGFVLHGPLGDTANSVRVGDAVQAGQNVIAKMQGDYGVEGAWERAVTTATGKKTSIEDLHKAFGSEELASRFVTMKVAELAAAHAAQRMTQENDGLLFGDNSTAGDYRTAVGQHADEVWADPGMHQTAMRELTANKPNLQNRLAADALHAGINPRNTETTDLDTYVTGAKQWMDAGAHLTDLIRGGLAREMFGANGQTLIKSAQDSFDFGYGSDNPTRLLNTTRRDYVNQTGQLFGRVKRAVSKGRVQLAQDITGATSDAAVTAARERQMQAESALSDGNVTKFSNLMKDRRTTKSSAVEWDQLVKDHRQFKQLIDPTLAPGEPYNLSDMLDRGFDSDALYSRVNGEPRTPSVAPGSAEWIRQNLNLPAGTLGLGRVTTKSIQQATADITRMQQAAEASVADPEKFEAAITAMRNYGFTELGLTERTLGLFDDPQRLADILNEHAQNLASDVFLPPDASPELVRKMNQIKQAGYKPMLGSHIGHIWDGSLPPLEDLKGAVSKRRRFSDALGLGATPVSNNDRAQDTQIRVLREVDRAFHSPKFVAPPRVTAETAIQVLRDEKILPPSLHLPEKLVYATTQHLGWHDAAIAQVAKTVGEDAAPEEYKKILAQTLDIRGIPRSKALKALTEPAEGTGPNGAWQWPGMDKASANLVLRGVLRGYADRPNYLFGLSALEDFARGGFYIFDKLAVAFPNSGAIQSFVNAPNELINMRNRLRFTLSPFFDARRITKTNYKMGLDKVAPVFDPLAHMEKNGTFDEAHELLSRLIGEPQHAGYDDADRYLYSQSIWGKYNARHYEAYYAHEKQAAGASDDEIKQGIRRVFEYGSTRVAGRTPLESSVNTLFFPFSFEKNLIRNTGMYFLDHPQQALLMTAAMEGYRKANQDDAISQWTQDHLPILNDLQKLNAFAHGISPGQPGGINAPLLNLFLPQLWKGKDFSKKNLEEMAPIYKDFGQLMSDSREQGRIALNASENALSYAVHLGAPRSPFDPYKPTTTPFAQRRDAEVMRNQFITQLTPVLDHNAHASPGQELTWPDDPQLPPTIQGQNINRTTIGLLVQRWYPAYDPDFSRHYAEDQASAANKAIAELSTKNPAQAQQWGVLVKLANTIASKINDNAFTTPETVQIMGQFRELSVAAAESQPGFLTFYNQHFRWLTGPVESVKGNG